MGSNFAPQKILQDFTVGQALKYDHLGIKKGSPGQFFRRQVLNNTLECFFQSSHLSTFLNYVTPDLGMGQEPMY